MPPPKVVVGEPLSYRDSRPDPLPKWPASEVKLFHPLDDIFILALPCVDANESLHFGVLYHAFRILSGNQDGKVFKFNSKTGEIGERIDLAWDEGVEALSVTWLVDDDGSSRDGKDWGMVPNFRSWVGIPSGELCEEWKSAFSYEPRTHVSNLSNISEKVKGRDGCCIVSQEEDSIEGAYIIPVADRKWLEDGNGATLSVDLTSVNTLQNAITLAVDIRRRYDAPSFVIIPKLGQPTIHFLFKSRNTYELYSNRRLHQLNDPCASTHYARFAWAILGLTRSRERALNQGIKVRVGVKRRWKELTLEEYRAMEKGQAGTVAKETSGAGEGEEGDRRGSKRRKLEHGSARVGEEEKIKLAADLMEGGEGRDEGEDLEGGTSSPARCFMRRDSSPASSPPPAPKLKDLHPHDQQQMMDLAERVDTNRMQRLALANERRRNDIGNPWKEEPDESEEDWPVVFPEMKVWIAEAREIRKMEARGEGVVEEAVMHE